MTAINRLTTTQYKGPAIVTYNSVVFYTRDAHVVSIKGETFPITANQFGTVDQRLKQIMSTITFTPVGVVSAGSIGVLYPHLSPVVGASALPTTDKALVVHPVNGKECLTFNNAFVTGDGMPSMKCSTQGTRFGQVKFMALGTNADGWSTSGHLFATADTAFSDTSFTVAGIATVAFSATLGGSPIITRAGWDLTFRADTAEETEDTQGTFDYLYTGGFNFTASCAPIGMTVATLSALQLIQGSGAARGASVMGKAADLVVTGPAGDVLVTIKSMRLQENTSNYPMSGDRIEKLDLVADTRTIATGAIVAPATITIVGA